MPQGATACNVACAASTQHSGQVSWNAFSWQYIYTGISQSILGNMLLLRWCADDDDAINLESSVLASYLIIDGVLISCFGFKSRLKGLIIVGVVIIDRCAKTGRGFLTKNKFRRFSIILAEILISCFFHKPYQQQRCKKYWLIEFKYRLTQQRIG
jgi:hypothetical protein